MARRNDSDRRSGRRGNRSNDTGIAEGFSGDDGGFLDKLLDRILGGRDRTNLEDGEGGSTSRFRSRGDNASIRDANQKALDEREAAIAATEAEIASKAEERAAADTARDEETTGYQDEIDKLNKALEDALNPQEPEVEQPFIDPFTMLQFEQAERQRSSNLDFNNRILDMISGLFGGFGGEQQEEPQYEPNTVDPETGEIIPGELIEPTGGGNSLFGSPDLLLPLLFQLMGLGGQGGGGMSGLGDLLPLLFSQQQPAPDTTTAPVPTPEPEPDLDPIAPDLSDGSSPFSSGRATATRRTLSPFVPGRATVGQGV